VKVLVVQKSLALSSRVLGFCLIEVEEGYFTVRNRQLFLIEVPGARNILASGR
jgi:hypothetical protein